MRFLTLLCALFVVSCSSGEERRPPNVVFVLADDLGYGDLGVYGATATRTPNLDRMAREGVRFTQFYSGTVCTPARAALLTGRYVTRQILGDTVQGVYFPGSPGGMAPEQITIAEILRASGYATGLIGKWHLGSRPEFLPNHQGFERFFGLPYSNDLRPLPLLDQGTELEQLDTPEKRAGLTPRYIEQALAFIRTSHAAGRPFFLYYPSHLPHVPLVPSPEFAGTSPRCDAVGAKRACGMYADVVAELDASIGAILAELQRLGIDEETLLVFTSDNGPWLLYGQDGGDGGGLRSGKGSTFEGGYRVPLVVRFKGHLPQGRVVTEPAMLVDWMPTLARFAGAALPEDRMIDGHDLGPLLRGDGPRDASGATFRLLYYRRDNETPGAYRKGMWKYKAPVGAPGESLDLPETHGALLFNLDDDPGETSDRSRDEPTIAAELSREMAEFDATLKADPWR